MLEDSINSSPRKSQRSIHRVRQLRKIKRLRCVENDEKATQVEKNCGDKTIKATTSSAAQDRLPTLADFYWEDPQPSSSFDATFSIKPEKYGEEFDPFEDELLLAVADRLDCGKAPRRKESYHPTKGQGFLNCSQLLEKEEAVRSSQIPPAKSLCPSITTDTVTQFSITESELVHYCTAAEKLEFKTNLNTPKTPVSKKHKSIVDSILEDFCSSPLSPDVVGVPSSHMTISRNQSPILLSCNIEERTPVFHFKNKPLRTYSCRRRSGGGARTSIAERLDSFAANENDVSNCSSELSIQEDLTQASETSVPADVDLNKSTKVCENLLNLSAYFSQHAVTDASTGSASSEIYGTASNLSEKSDVNSFQTSVEAMTQLIENILNLRKKHFKFVWAAGDSSDEFHGFSSEEDDIQWEQNKLNETLIDVVDSSEYQRFNAKKVLHEVHNGSQALEEEPTTSRLINGGDCEKNFLAPINTDFTVQERDIISDSEEEWNDDCDFFKTFKTQDALKRKPCTLNAPAEDHISVIPEFQGFMSASKKSIHISDDSKQRAEKMLAEIAKDLDQEFKVPQNIAIVSKNKISTYEKKLPTLPGFKAASKKSICISEDAQKRALAVFTDVPMVNIEAQDLNPPSKDPSTDNGRYVDEAELGDIQLSEWLIDDSDNPSKDKQFDAQFKGFQTASNKNIKISAAARARALKLLDDLQQFPEPSDIDAVRETKQNFINTASNYCLNNEVIKIKDDFTKTVNQVKQHIFEGFRTASRKSIEISDEAKTRAASILETLPDIPKSNPDKLFHPEAAFDNMQLSEWPLNDNNDSIALDAPETSTIARKFERSEHKQDHLTKPVCKSYSTNTVHRTPLTPNRENSLLCATSSFSSLISGNLPLTSFAKSEIISRRNLLSLSKRKKNKTQQDIQMVDVESSSTETPIKHTYKTPATPATPNVQEFFAAVPNSSTPRLLKGRGFQTPQNVTRNDVAAKVDELDSDFQQIEWGPCNNSSTSINKSMTPSNLNLSSGENVTVGSSNPSPMQRISRLRMYGKPPPVSPILMSSKNNCRPSGLRRGRSATKKQNELEKLEIFRATKNELIMSLHRAKFHNLTLHVATNVKRDNVSIRMYKCLELKIFIK